MTGGYVELQVTTNLSFLHGASHPDEMALTAAALGHRAIGIADRNTLGGVVRMHVGAKRHGIRALVGCRVEMTDAPPALVYPTDRAAYGRLSRLISLGRRRGDKGDCLLRYADLLEFGEGQLVIALPPAGRLTALRLEEFGRHLRQVAADFPGRTYLAVQQLHLADDRRRLDRLGALADRLAVPLVATNDVHYHAAHRAPLQDVLTCIREKTTLARAGRRLFPNAERHLKPAGAMAALFAARPDAVVRTLEIADRCRFSLEELRYEYPAEPVPEGSTPQEELIRRTWEGAAARWPEGVPEPVRATLERELTLIGQLGYAPYFLSVHDIVRFARDRDILCQGRGSAANSAVCYALSITAVDPARNDLLFERFISAARNEPPDIDVDFEHERREEVIQYIYGKYGRDRAGLTAITVSYRSKMAVREVGKVMGLSADTIEALSKTVWSWGREEPDDSRIRQAGIDPEEPTIATAIRLARELIGFPRHRSQHPGGFVITRGRLDEVVPIEKAAMEGRTVVEWDKDDLDHLGILKIDVLALGMLTCLRKGFDMLSAIEGRPFGLTDVPAEDPETYAMIRKADTIGVFQIESRAQMAMLPRLGPETFYDLVIEVAIVRPGPIQGDMVHPYIRRRKGLEEPDLPTPALKEVLEKTLGVPLFQEQAMRIAIVCAGFSGEEADQLRRAMATFRRMGIIKEYHDRFVGGMVRNGYDPAFAERCFRQIEGFGNYGFPESHAYSFALLAYASAWLKCRHPAIFCAALLNSQPMGFYAPAQIVRDAREHGVEVRAVDVNHSEWDCVLEAGRGGPAVRLGFRLVKGFREADAIALVKARADGYRTVQEVWRRAALGPAALERLAQADGWQSIGLGRREALWQVRALGAEPLPLFAVADARLLPGDNRGPVEHADEPAVILPAMPLGESVVEDYRAVSLSLRTHPLSLLRPRLRGLGYSPARGLEAAADGRKLAVAGLTLVRQRPGTASGVVFVTLEDETRVANIVVWSAIFDRFRRVVLGATIMGVEGRVQKEGEVIHLVADRLVDLSPLLGELVTIDRPVFPASRDFR
ncbi:error-prone DNA polymerase [Azospirillum thermophilum]|uniref:Error-prone DNA polymerase n=1 Tax=Azospirillum thermophilum TaxID=2202148 RepID=A0A2S2CLR1_9PROT|nr:error-prone DNA polymerase [Azospirillum thermophilum]AWK85458.1 error-prone DNA polymerase [Azospirillum thermophilum]